MVLLVGAALFVRSLTTVLSQDAGFDRDNVLVVATDPAVAGYEGERLTVTTRSCASGSRRARRRSRQPLADAAGQQRRRQLDAEYRRRWRTDRRGIVTLRVFQCRSSGYFATLGTAADARPRFPSRRFSQSTRVVIVNESLARRFFPDQDPLGRRITIGRSERRRDLEIVGARARHEVPDAAGAGAAHRVSPGRAAEQRAESLCGRALVPALYRRLPTASPTSCASARCRCAAADRNRQRPHPRIARQRAGHGVAGIEPWRHRARPGLRGALRPAGLCRVATGEGDRPAARARGDARARAAGGARATALIDCRRRHRHRRGGILALGRYVRSLLFQVSPSTAVARRSLPA